MPAILNYMAYMYFDPGNVTHGNWIDMASRCRSVAVSREPSVDRQQHPLVATVGSRSCAGCDASRKGLRYERQVCSSFSYDSPVSYMDVHTYIL